MKKGDDGYVLSALKKDPKSFRYKHIMSEVKKCEDHAELYQQAKAVLPKLELSDNTIRYYAEMIQHYPIGDLKRLSTTYQSVYLLCHIVHRYQTIQDNLMVAFIYLVTKLRQAAKKEARDLIFNDKLEVTENAKKAAVVFRIFDDESIDDTVSFGTIRKRAYKQVKQGHFSVVADYLEGLLFDFQETLWDAVAEQAGLVTKNLRPIFSNLVFSSDEIDSPTLAAITALKAYFATTNAKEKAKLRTDLPIKLFSKEWRNHGFG